MKEREQIIFTIIYHQERELTFSFMVREILSTQHENVVASIYKMLFLLLK